MKVRGMSYLKSGIGGKKLIIGLLKTCLLPTTTNVTPTCFKRVFSEADCGLLNFTRVDQDLREDPELDNDRYSL